MRSVHVAAYPKTVANYRALLRSDWTDATVKQAAALIRRVLQDSECRIAFSWENRSNGAACVIPDDALDALYEAMQRFYVDRERIAAPRWKTDPQRRRLLETLEETCILLNFQLLAKIRLDRLVVDKSRFLANCQCLLFNVAALFLLPSLNRKTTREQHDFAGSALGLHVGEVWRGDPVQQSVLDSLLASATGDKKKARRALEFAFACTPATSHDYLTMAYQVWYSLIDDKDYEGAADFAVSLIRGSPPEHVPELRSMLKQAYGAKGARR